MHWEELVPKAALKAGAHLIADEQPSFSMHWSSIDEFWEVQTYDACICAAPEKCSAVAMHFSGLYVPFHLITIQCSPVTDLPALLQPIDMHGALTFLFHAQRHKYH